MAWLPSTMIGKQGCCAWLVLVALSIQSQVTRRGVLALSGTMTLFRVRAEVLEQSL